MSWSFSATGRNPSDAMTGLRNAVDANQYCPKDGRIEAAAEPLVSKSPVDAGSVTVSTNGHLEADGYGYVNVSVTYAKTPPPA